MIKCVYGIAFVLLLGCALCNRPPVFVRDFYVVRVSEDTPVGTSLVNVTASDADSGQNGALTYRLEAIFSSALGTFAVRPESGELLLNSPLDREETSSFHLTVIVQDGGAQEDRTNVVVTVGDVNDNAPLFPTNNYSFSLNEGEKSRVGLKVVDIRASDPDEGSNGTVQYRLLTNPHELFLIYEQTGSLLVQNTIDRESLGQSNLVIVVEAFDLGTPPQSSQVSVNINIVDEPDTPPKFSDLDSISVDEDFPVGVVIVDVNATTPDTDVIVEYSFEGNSGPFEILRSTGEISLVKYLDFEEQSLYFLVVAATGRKLGNLYPSVKSIVSLSANVVNVNDEVPRFERAFNNFAVLEEQPSLYQIEQVSAYDGDAGSFGNLSYSVTSIEDTPLPENYPFATNPENGIIFTTRQLDFESTQQAKSFVFKLWAKDGGTPPLIGTTQVTIVLKDVDEPPVFSMPTYTSSVDENLMPGTEVTVVQADDLDSQSTKLHYKLWAFGNYLNSFGINVTSGVIHTRLRLDREAISDFNLIVQASDQSASNLFSTATVKVTVNDVNDHAPSFSEHSYLFSASEMLDPGAPIGTVQAIDFDAGSNSEIVYLTHDLPPNLLLNAKSGIISVHSALDYETEKRYHFSVSAIDGGNPSMQSSADVAIRIKDANDNAPRIHASSNASEVFENLDENEVVFSVSATDEDSGINGMIATFQIIGDANAVKDFAIDHNGVVFTTRVLDRENIGMYDVVIRVTDSGLLPMSSETTVTVRVKDVIDSVPYFSRFVYDTTISSFTPAGSVIVHVSATSDDDLSQLFMHYTLEPDLDLFTVHPTNGSVLCTADIDPTILHGNQYKLTVFVSAMANGPQNNILTNFISFVVSVQKSTCSPTLPEVPPILLSQPSILQNDDFVSLVTLKQSNTLPVSCDIQYSLSFLLEGLSQFIRIGSSDGVLEASTRLPSGNFTIVVHAVLVDRGEEAQRVITIHSTRISSQVASNSVNFFFPNVLASQFVARQLGHVLQVLADIFAIESNDVMVLSVQNDAVRAGAEMLVTIPDRPQPYMQPWRVVSTLLSHAQTLRQKLSPFPIVGYASCGASSCHENAYCSSKIAFTGDSAVHRTTENIVISAGFNTLSVCTCPPGFLASSQCREAEQVCRSSPCKFGGTCTSTADGYRCTCPPRTTGRDCSTVCVDGRCNPCQPNPCKNGGQCSIAAESFTCDCPYPSSGPRCELTKVTLSQSSRVTLPILSHTFSTTAIHFRFATTHAYGLLLYSSGHSLNFQMMSVEVENGQLRVAVRTGLQTFLVAKTSSPSLLNDGRWHSVKISILHKVVSISVSGCVVGTPLTRNHRGAVIGMCTLTILMERILGNIGPLRIGSIESVLKDSQVTSSTYSGCFDALTVDGALIDLSSQASQLQDVDHSCLPLAMRDCSAQPCLSGSCHHLWNGSRCSCDPTDSCSNGVQSRAVHLSAGRGHFRIGVLTGTITSLLVTVKTLAHTSVITSLGNHSVLLIHFGTVVWQGNGFKLEVPAFVSDGLWHKLSLSSSNHRLSLDIDDGRLTADTPFGAEIATDDLQFGSSQSPSTFEGCIAELTVNGRALSVDSSLSPAVSIGCPLGDACTPLNPCSHRSTCSVQFGQTVCTCALDVDSSDSSCSDPCSSDPCGNGGTCVGRGADSFVCACPFGHRGPRCGEEYCPAPHHYRGSAGGGECLPCPCSLAGSDGGLCNGTSQCACRDDIPTFSPAAGAGSLQCQRCSCHARGSQHLRCNSLTGRCLCQRGVTGVLCDRCADGNAVLTMYGCRGAVSVEGQMVLDGPIAALSGSEADGLVFKEFTLALMAIPAHFRLQVTDVSLQNALVSFSVLGYSDYATVLRNQVAAAVDSVLEGNIVGSLVVRQHWFTGSCAADGVCYRGVACGEGSRVTCGPCPEGFGGGGVRCTPLAERAQGLDSDSDGVPDTLDNEPFLFNPDQTRIAKPQSSSTPFCPAGRANGVTWSLTLLGSRDPKPCPGRHVGNMTRLCSGNGWKEPNTSRCLQPEAVELTAITDETSNGLLPSDEILNFGSALMSALVVEKDSTLEGDLVSIVDYLAAIIDIESQISSLSGPTWSRAVVVDVVERVDSLWYPWSATQLGAGTAMKGLQVLNDMLTLALRWTLNGGPPSLSYMTYRVYPSLVDNNLVAGLQASSLTVSVNLPQVTPGDSASLAVLPPPPALTAAGDDRTVNSPVVAVEVLSAGGSRQSIVVTSPMIKAVLNYEVMSPRCVFVDELGEWSSSGCEVLAATSTHVTCSCKHLSVFAVTVSASSLQRRSYDVHIATYVFETLACLFLLGSILILLYFRVPGEGYYVGLFLCILFGLTWICFTAGIDRTDSGHVTCIVFSVLIQLTSLSSLVWCFLGLVLTLLHLQQPFRKWTQVPYYFAAAGLLIPVLLTGLAFGILALTAGSVELAVGYPSLCLLTSDGPYLAVLAPLCVVALLVCLLYAVTVFKFATFKKEERQRSSKTARAYLILVSVATALFALSLAMKFISTVSQLPTAAYLGLQIAAAGLDLCLGAVVLLLYSKSAYSRWKAEKTADRQLEEVREMPEGKVSSLRRTGSGKIPTDPVPTPVAMSVPISPVSIRDPDTSRFQLRARTHSWSSFPSPSPLEPLSPVDNSRRLAIIEGAYNESDVQDWDSEWSSNTSSDSPEPPSIMSPEDQFGNVSPGIFSASTVQHESVHYIQQLNSMSDREPVGNSSVVSSHVSSATRSGVFQPRQPASGGQYGYSFDRDIPVGTASATQSIVSRYLSVPGTRSSVSASRKSYSLPRLVRSPHEEFSDTAESYV